MNPRLRSSFALGLIGAAALLCSAQAAPVYSDLVFFGDSLSDTGNVLSLTTAAAPPPFPAFTGAEGRFSNGPAWTEYLAAGLGMPGNANPANLLFNGAAVVPIGVQGGQNFAYGGARTGLGGAAGATTGLIGQLINWNGAAFGASLTRAADPDALYVLLAGANDMRDLRSGAPGALSPDTAALNLANAMGLLAQAGARNFLVGNLPDLGKTPEAVALNVVAESTASTVAFNTALAASTSSLDAFFLNTFGIDLQIHSLDLYGLFEDVFDDAVNNGGATFGITNVATPCIAPVAPGAYYFPGSTDINCAVSGFSDPLHPSALAHRVIGQAAMRALPEPAPLVLIALAGVALWLSRRKQA